MPTNDGVDLLISDGVKARRIQGCRVILGWALPVRAEFIILHADSPYMLQRPFSCNLLWNLLFRRLPGLGLVFLFFLGMPAVLFGQALDVRTDVISGTCTTQDTLNIVITGGTSPYQVVITGGPTIIAPFTLTLPATATSVSREFVNLGYGNYVVTVTDAAGTVQVKNPTLFMIPGPNDFALSEISGASCLNDAVLGVTVDGGTAPYTFLYNGNTVGATTGGAVSGQATGLPGGVITFTVRDANGCTLSQTVYIDRKPNLQLLMDNSSEICQGTSKQITITSNAATYSWSPAAGLSSDTAKDPIASPAATTTYTLTATLGVCTMEGLLNIQVIPAPVAAAVSPDTTCYGKDIYLQGSGGTQYMWTPTTYLNNPTIANPVVVDPTSSIVYNLTVTDANGCKSLKPAVVDLYVRPPYVVAAVPDTLVTVGQRVGLQAIDVQGVGFDQYAWTPGTFLNNPLVADPVATFSETGIYTYVVNATARDGCSGSASVTIKVYAVADIFVPGAFTPNGDGHNDVLRAIPVSMRSFRYLSVFSRWGQEVFTTTNAGIGWDGNINGRPAPAGTYVWMTGGIGYSGRVVEKRGTVELIR